MQSDSSFAAVSHPDSPLPSKSGHGRKESSHRKGVVTALLLVFAGAFLRSPAIFLHGRVWGEEGLVFLVGNWHLPFGKILLAPQFGYFSIWDNFFSAMAVRWLPLTLVSLLFSWSAILLLLVTAWFVYECEVFSTRNSKLLAMLPLLFTAPNVESWLNLINSEFYFGVCAAVILVSNASRWRRQRGLMLALASLSGPLTTLLAPMFVLRAVVRRQRGEIVQAAIVCAGALAQVAVSLTTTTANRKVHPDVAVLGPVLFNRQIVLAFLDRAVAKKVSLFFFQPAHQTLTVDLAAWLLVLIAAVLLFRLLRGSAGAWQLLGIALWLAFFEQMLALNGGLALVGPGYAERYAFTPNFLLGLAVAAGATTLTLPRRLLAARVLLGFFLLTGLADYFVLPLLTKKNLQIEPWRQQALRWQQDATLPLQPTPAVFEAIHLSKEH